MRHRRTTAKLGRTAAHRKAMLRNMVTSLLEEGRIKTTIPKAKEARRVAERMITFAKRGDLHARRQVLRVVRDPKVVAKLFDEIGPRFANRQGGYTRVLKTGFRNGDNAPMSILEILTEDTVKAPARPKRKPAEKAAVAPPPAVETAPEAQEEASEATQAEEEDSGEEASPDEEPEAPKDE
ncbi:MAG: 50S ribosomal protein L17 [Gemmatimonadota bacterium]|nr:50S ribosomal protein L17 [Gemmatimonadota bacterium]MDP6530063.1 50S ribosomal protein L17 [Gemmatimonadota bacterium]MDP6803390.1 50S ribosomal protein L17 [Gemmatimonadota bacterium]MDP7032401.1 50S ribosomal protein L17 [Gemmatimonadota bacterium]